MMGSTMKGSAAAGVAVTAVAAAALLAGLWRTLFAAQPLDGLRTGLFALALAVIVAGRAWLRERGPRMGVRAARMLVLGAAAMSVVGAVQLAEAWRQSTAFDSFDGSVLDIGANTHCAAAALLHGRNPYVARCQRTRVVPDPARGVVREADGTVRVRGVIYRSGYPYFPLMVAAYVPAVASRAPLAALRCTALAALLASLFAAAALVRSVVPRGDRALAFGATAAALLSVPQLGFELFEECATDVVIAPVLLLAFAAWERRRPALAGSLAAATLGMKLFPGALVIAAMLVATHADAAARRRFVTATALASLAIFAPAVIAAPMDFYADTMLFYAVVHGVDGSSIAGHLPPGARGAWFVAGGALVAAALSTARSGRPGATLRAFVLADLLFLAFNKMTRWNYFMPLGAALMITAWLPSTAVRRDP